MQCRCGGCFLLVDGEYDGFCHWCWEYRQDDITLHEGHIKARLAYLEKDQRDLAKTGRAQVFTH